MIQTTGADALVLDSVSKRFGGVQAVQEASLVCKAGEVHALVGENGAGKSTLIKMACGALRPDEGRVVIAGQELRKPSPRAARGLGLLTAYQDTSLVPAMSVAENVVLSYHGVRKPGFRLRLREAEVLLEPFDLPFDPSSQVGALSPGARQLLEVVRAIIHRPKVLLLDEPTAALDAGTIARLEQLIAAALEHGTAVLYVTHRLDEVQRMADQLTVIRDGRIQGTYPREGWNVDDIVTMMVGTRTNLAFPPRRARPATERVVLETSGFRGRGFGPIECHIDAGEVVGVAGAEGNGQYELVRTLVGLRPGGGEISIDGEPVSIATPAAARRRGITFQSGDRASESVFHDLSVMDNVTLAAGSSLGPLGLIMRSRQRQVYEPVARELKMVAASSDQPISQLSGGNQQKAVVARSMVAPTKVLVVDQPTQGVDARARLDIYRALRDQANDGTAVLVNSSDASELAGLCDRVYVMSRGAVVRELAAADLSESVIVDSFVNAGARHHDGPLADPETSTRSRRYRGAFARLLGSPWAPFAVVALLMIAIGAYTESYTSVFLNSSNLSSLIIIALPFILAAVGQQSVLLAGGFDISVGSTMSLGVVLASFWVTSGTLAGSIGGLVLCLLIGVGVGLLNAAVIRGLGVSPLIATIATLSILAGIGIILRPTPGGTIGFGLSNVLNKQISFLPISFIVVVVFVVFFELWLRLTNSGLSVRATGLSEEASRRTGLRVDQIKVLAYVICSVMAVIAGLFLSVQVSVGESNIAASYALPAFTACFLGGAALTGGRGSFVGALLGALFLTLLINVAPLLNLPDATAQVAQGVLTIAAVAGYSFRNGVSGPRFWRRRGSTTPNVNPGEETFASGLAPAAVFEAENTINPDKGSRTR